MTHGGEEPLWSPAREARREALRNGQCRTTIRLFGPSDLFNETVIRCNKPYWHDGVCEALLENGDKLIMGWLSAKEMMVKYDRQD